MRLQGVIALALVLCGCAGIHHGIARHDAGLVTPTLNASDRVAQAGSFASKAAAANAACAEAGQQPGTTQHAECVKRLLRAEGQRTRDLAATLANRAAKNHYTCIDQVHLRLVRCYDI